MTARPPEPLHDDAFSAEERELAARIAKLDASAGPSAALDARILAAARAAAPAQSRRAPRWPRAVGAAAVLVAAVGLAWQLKPMFALPPPPVSSEHAGSGRGAGAEADVVVQVDAVPRAAPPVPAAVGDEAAAAAAPAAVRKAAPVAGGGVAPTTTKPARARKAAPAHRGGEFVDEALPPPAPPAPAAPPPAPQARNLGLAASSGAAAERAAVATPEASNAAPSPAFGDIRADARLPIAGWIARIRARRDAGDLDGARASLARFVATHPRARIPNDLQPLLDDGDPWSP